MREFDCDVVLVTNDTSLGAGRSRAARLLDAVCSLGVEVVYADYLHRPADNTPAFMASQYVWDAILAVAERSEPDRQLWLMDTDCVWFDPRRVFARAPGAPGIGCIEMDYPQDWKLNGWTPRQIGELAQRMGASGAPGMGVPRAPGMGVPGAPVKWVGGELLAGAAADLRTLVTICKELELQAMELGAALHTEEHLLTLAWALGRVDIHDLSAVARRVWTGPRHGAPQIDNPEAIGVWHLPAEKGLGFRRAAREVLAGQGRRLVEDLDVPARALKRFNIAGGGWQRRLRDDSWIAGQRLRDGVSGLRDGVSARVSRA
jgi:hypothetical protein